MRMLLINVSILVMIISFGLRVILIMSYSSLEELQRKVIDLSKSSKITDRLASTFCQFFIENNLYIGTFGVLLFLVSLIIK